MNRIYQGRVTKVELIDEEGKLLPIPENWDSTEALRQHNALFLDAVIY